MGLFSKQKKKQQPSGAQAPLPPVVGDPTLPGLSGYRRVGPLAKNAMPDTRFNYRRPDGKG